MIMQEFYKTELANIEKEAKGYLKFAEKVFEILSLDDPYQLRKELTSFFYTYFKCEKAIYCSANRIISVPNVKLSADEIHAIKAWFDLRTFDNNIDVYAYEPINRNDYDRYRITNILGIGAGMPLFFSGKNNKKKFTSYFALGFKKSGQPFSEAEIDYLKRIRDELGMIAEEDYKWLKTKDPYVPVNEVRKWWNDSHGLEGDDALQVIPPPYHRKWNRER